MKELLKKFNYLPREIKTPISIFLGGIILLLVLKLLLRPKKVIIYTIPEEYDYYW